MREILDRPDLLQEVDERVGIDRRQAEPGIALRDDRRRAAGGGEGAATAAPLGRAHGVLSEEVRRSARASLDTGDSTRSSLSLSAGMKGFEAARSSTK